MAVINDWNNCGCRNITANKIKPISAQYVRSLRAFRLRRRVVFAIGFEIVIVLAP
jgi:hypothetical protein